MNVGVSVGVGVGVTGGVVVGVGDGDGDGAGDGKRWYATPPMTATATAPPATVKYALRDIPLPMLACDSLLSSLFDTRSPRICVSGRRFAVFIIDHTTSNS